MTAPRTTKPNLDPRLDLYILSQQRMEEALSRDRELATTRHEQVMRILGSEDLDEKGLPIGRGLTGRVMRLEVWKRVTDGWIRYMAGAAASAALLLGAIWWLAEKRLEGLFK